MNIDAGRVVEITDTDIVLETAAWISDTGRTHDLPVTVKA